MDFSRLSISFVHPGYLVLLAVVPAVIWFSRRSLAALGPVRRLLAIALRSLVLVLLILALAEVQKVRTNDRLSVLFLLDQSQSVPAEHRQSMLAYVNRAIEKHKPRNDQAGVIVFGESPRVELPPMEGPPQLSAVESLIDPEHTDLAAALKLSQALFPENTAKRIVLVSDGNQNRGDAMKQAELARDAGVQIDVLPIEYHYDSEVIVEKVVMPADVRRDETVNLKVVVRSEQPATGRLQLLMKTEGAVVDSTEQHVSLKKGPNAFTVRQRIKEPNFYTFEAHFIPDPGVPDRIADSLDAFSVFVWDGHTVLFPPAPLPTPPYPMNRRTGRSGTRSLQLSVLDPRQNFGRDDPETTTGVVRNSGTGHLQSDETVPDRIHCRR